MRAVIYARYSSNKQREQSIEGQLRVCKKFCENNRFPIVDEYIDRAKSGRTANRPEFQRMLNDAKKKIFDVIVVYQIDRFARNVLDYRTIEEALKAVNVRILSATEPVTSVDKEEDDDCFLTRGILALFAENFSRDLGKKVSRGMREAYYKRLFPGPVPFGYKKVENKIIVDENDAKIVKLIFKDRADGRQIPEILNHITASNLRRSDGKKMSRTTVYSIIKSDKYTGKFVNPFDENDIIDDMFPALVDERTFRIANLVVGSRHVNHPKRSSPGVLYCLTGKIFDDKTGCLYKGRSGTSKTKKVHRYYACKETGLWVDKDKFENKIYDTALGIITSDENIDIITRELFKNSKDKYKSEVIDSLKAQKEELELKASKIADKFIDADSSMYAFLNKKAAEISAEIELIQKKIDEEYKKVPSYLRMSEEQFKVFLKKVLIYAQKEEKYKERFLSNLINAIYVNKETDSCVLYLGAPGISQVNLEQNRENLMKLKANPDARVRNNVKLVNRSDIFANFCVFDNGLCGFEIGNYGW